MTLDLVALISQVGFPIAVTCYLLFRFEGIIGQNTAAIQALGSQISAVFGQKRAVTSGL